ncbi:hypothetical protein H6P81_011931 [Aristolochia fimbriata]|uniref:CRIB domain-containing protein n=1 Tax=Aristolochia fimbriata TaxID=158543 RepID=A0AAV7EEZ3_ARIFI|nr:hypothetical protein H6P81_011931 [Aristolochia fimbriata]
MSVIKSDHVIGDSKAASSHLEPDQLINHGDLEVAAAPVSITEGGTHRRTRSPSVVDGLWNKQQILPPQMTTKMKGLLKGLRYISQIFETPDDKEQEMQIGFPTDVKHVAHIGWDGPSVNPPSWVSNKMNEYRTTPEFSSAPLGPVGEGKDLQFQAAGSTGGGNQEPAAKDAPKSSRRHCSSSLSPSRDGTDGPKPSRRQANGEHSDVPRHPRRRHGSGASSGSGGGGGGGGGDSPTKEGGGPGSQQSRRRKSKGSGGGSTRVGRSKAHGSTLSDPDIKNTGEPTPALTAIAEGEGN